MESQFLNECHCVRHIPKGDCSFCDGTGSRVVPEGLKIEDPNATWRQCDCVKLRVYLKYCDDCSGTGVTFSEDGFFLLDLAKRVEHRGTFKHFIHGLRTKYLSNEDKQMAQYLKDDCPKCDGFVDGTGWCLKCKQKVAKP